MAPPKFALYSTGSNSDGQLGISSPSDAHSFSRVRGLPPSSRPTALAFGGQHTIAICEDVEGEVGLYGCGSNAKGQLGCANGDARTTFERIEVGRLLGGLVEEDRRELEGEYDVKAIAASWETSFVVLTPREGPPAATRSDVLLTFGGNDWAESRPPGLPPLRPKAVVQRFPLAVFWDERGATRVRRIEAGPRHVVCEIELEGEGKRKVVAWGAGRHGQLGSGGKGPRVGWDTIWPRKEGDTSATVREFKVGKDHTTVLLESSTATPEYTIYTFGHPRASLSSLSIPPSTSPSIGATWSGSYALFPPTSTTSAPTLYGIGSNTHSQLALPPSPSPPSAPVSIPLPPPSTFTPEKLVCGSEHVLLLGFSPTTEKKEVWGWGWNEHGNLGDGTTGDVGSPKVVWGGMEGEVLDAWAGNGTSWVLVREEE
ncbi:regulator of chromosome condensation, RCC1 repeat containing protein [Pseudohyphozyma bogoriensis]|nr:regulator of chromosome condensation, RCC1 repeat containing protein [Pseudohyphozyma bogoriensis]